MYPDVLCILIMLFKYYTMAFCYYAIQDLFRYYFDPTVLKNMFIDITIYVFDVA